MLRTRFFFSVILAFLQLVPWTITSSLAQPQDWHLKKTRGTLKVVDLFTPSGSVLMNYAEGLVSLDRDNNWVPCLAEDWRWIDERTIEFALRRGVTFQNGEEFNAEAVRINWEQYKQMDCPRPMPFLVLPDATVLEIVDEHRVRFIFPEPEGLAYVRVRWFLQFAPAFFASHTFAEKGWGYLPGPGPWGTGPFQMVAGSALLSRPSDRIVLEAHKGYWDRQYPKLEKVIFENTLVGNRDEAL